LLNILESYFCNAAKYHPEPKDVGKTTYFSKVGASFILGSAIALFKLQLPTSPLFPRHENLLQSLTTGLQDLHDDLVVHPPPDYLFFASLIYVFWLLVLDTEIIKTDKGQNLILTILQYHTRVTQLRKDEEGFCNTHPSLFTFKRDWPDFVERAEGLGVVLPSPAVQLPTDPPTPEDADIQDELWQLSGDAIVDIRVDPLGERALKDTASTHSSLEMADDNVTA